ncbi:MAG: hypothetical protein JWQ09_2529 [Segetibacter sp.]|nr:hypothetical protein [Segetibacter sp.]
METILYFLGTVFSLSINLLLCHSLVPHLFMHPFHCCYFKYTSYFILLSYNTLTKDEVRKSKSYYKTFVKKYKAYEQVLPQTGNDVYEKPRELYI